LRPQLREWLKLPLGPADVCIASRSVELPYLCDKRLIVGIFYTLFRWRSEGSVSVNVLKTMR